ncbi:hypothetical protein L9F63_025441, partial [Diploptera punctata]
RASPIICQEMFMLPIFFVIETQALRLAGVSGHGRLMNPPARNSMWRFGFPNPVNYNDNELFCGGHAG